MIAVARYAKFALVAMVAFVALAVFSTESALAVPGAPGMSRAEIRSMPITQRPDRPGHWYGNTVRRRARRGG